MAEEINEALGRAMAEVNSVFDKLRATVEEEVERGATQVDVAEIGRRAGLEIQEGTLDDLRIDRTVYVLPWLPWYHWFPWRPLWCWWWRLRYPWYRCCPWWWYNCNWYPW